MRSLFVIVAVVLSSTALSGRAMAAWPGFGRAACDATGDQRQSAVATDGAGGAIVAWVDLRTPPSVIAVQHVLSTGEVDPVWPHFGRAVIGAPVPDAVGGQFVPQVVPDGAGGAIVVWMDERSADTGIDIFAQHVLAGGTRDATWPILGLPLSVIDGTQAVPTMVADGSGGALVTWMDDRTGASEQDVYAQHVLASGAVDPLWPANGLLVCAANGAQQFPVIADDGSGGAIIAWFDTRTSPTEVDIFAQRILNTGAVAPGWPANGLAVCSAPFGQSRPTIVADGTGGAVIAWEDGRNQSNVRIAAQHVLGSGNVDPAWPLDGTVISGAATFEQRPLATSDGAGGAVVTWTGFSDQPNINNVFAQHVQATGVVDPAWPAGGRALSLRAAFQSNAEIASDGSGGAIVSWDESGKDVFVQHVEAGGALDAEFPADGRSVCEFPSHQADPAIVAAGVGGAIVSWTDDRAGFQTDVFAMQVLEAGNPTAVPAPDADALHVSALPNPFSGSTHITFMAAGDGAAEVRIFDVRGRSVRSFAVAAHHHGDVQWDGRTSRGDAAPSGVYFCRVSTPGGEAVERLVLVR